jgi:hypothetical protein
MNAVKWLAGLFLFFTCATSYAQDKVHNNYHLKLECTVTFNNYDGVDNASLGAEIVLTNAKHNPGGSVQVSQTDDYEFWVMAHGVQTTNDQRLINSFQVAIKDKTTNTFMHALSDSNYSPAGGPEHARISLIDYHPNSFLEEGELMFECRRID